MRLCLSILTLLCVATLGFCGNGRGSSCNAAPSAGGQTVVQYRVEHRGLFGRRTVLVPITPTSFVPATTQSFPPVHAVGTATTGDCAGGNCSVGGTRIFRR